MGSKPLESTVTFERGLRTVESPLGRRRSMAGLDDWWLAPDDVGALQRMPGDTLFLTIATGTRVRTMRRARKSDGEFMNLVGYTDSGPPSNIQIQHLDSDGDLVEVITDTTTPAITVANFSSVVLNDTIYFFNGTDAPWKSTISRTSPTVTAAGIARPDNSGGSAVTLASGSGGGESVVGVVNYYFSVMTGTTESALSVASGPFDAGSGDEVDITFPNDAEWNSKTVRIYRTLADFTQPFLLSQVTLGASGTVVNDNSPDSQLTNLPFLHGDPPPSGILSATVFVNRIFGLTTDSILYWTDVDEGESWWTESNGFKALVNQDDGDVATALVRDTTGLYVFKENHIYRVVIGQDVDNIEIQEFEPVTQQGRSLGTPSGDSVISAHSAIVFYWNKGLYQLTSGGINYLSRDIEDDLSAIRNQDESEGVHVGFYPGTRHLWLSVPLSAGTRATHTYLYDMDAGRWIGRKTIGFEKFLSTFSDDGDEQFWGTLDDSGGAGIFVHQLGEGLDTSVVATATATLPPFYGSSPSTQKIFLQIDVHYVPQASGTFDVELVVDGKTSASDTISSLSQVVANTSRSIHEIKFGHPGRELQIKIVANDGEPQTKILGITYYYHEFVTS